MKYLTGLETQNKNTLFLFSERLKQLFNQEPAKRFMLYQSSLKLNLKVELALPSFKILRSICLSQLRSARSLNVFLSHCFQFQVDSSFIQVWSYRVISIALLRKVGLTRLSAFETSSGSFTEKSPMGSVSLLFAYYGC